MDKESKNLFKKEHILILEAIRDMLDIIIKSQQNLIKKLNCKKEETNDQKFLEGK